MPRPMREESGGLYCHVLNRGNGRAEVFHDEADYAGFVALLGLALGRIPMRIAAACLMPNHFHLVVRPWGDGELSRWMQWLMTSHVRRYHRRYGTSGHVWQGRYKSFMAQRRRPSVAERAAGVVETADPLWTVVRYVERNPLRGGLVERAEDWPWSSLYWWVKTGPGSAAQRRCLAPFSPGDQTTEKPTPAEMRPVPAAAEMRPVPAAAEMGPVPAAAEMGTGTSAPRFALRAAQDGSLRSQSPFPLELDRPADWVEIVNRAQTDEELAALRRYLSRGRPFGTDAWVRRIAKKLGLESTLRPRGRPRKHTKK